MSSVGLGGGSSLDVAREILADSFIDNVPPGLEPTVAEIEGVLEAAY